jgi:hypothetical protein
VVGRKTTPNQFVTEILDFIYALFKKTAAIEHTKLSSQLSSFTMEEEIRLKPFPFNENVIFRESSFFKKSNALLYLPTLTEVREVAHHFETLELSS